MTFLHHFARLGAQASADEPLAAHCSWRTGGAARLWAQPHTERALGVCLEHAGEHEMPAHVVGLGSNLLFPDQGIPGVVMRLVGELASWRLLEGDRVWVGAGAVNAHLVRGVLAQGLVGAEFLMLIPGTMGGAVAMNAGTKEQELSSILRAVEIFEPGESGWNKRRLEASELGLGYRHAQLPQGSVVVSAELQLGPGDVDAARARAKADKVRRNRTQPYKLASVGSTFANPEGDWAGRLIEAAGLKGHVIGGAQISELHANFLINRGGATSDDFLRLMALARAKVRADFGVELRPEVRFVGLDGMAHMAKYELELEQRGGSYE